MSTNPNYVLIIASGGIDSTACIHYYKKIGFNIELIFFDYGQLALKNELVAVSSIASYYNISVRKITIRHLDKFKDGLVLGRNAAFYFLALMHFKKPNGLISSGIHYGTGYYDCSEIFFNDIKKIFLEYSQGVISVGAPFLNFNKVDIIKYCTQEKVPIHLTYSCELGKEQPCGQCATCKDLISIYVRKKHKN